ncbi:DUF3971 domain-containing protein [Pelagibius litoralis]|nr:DUF3971 domain-containing protein [Pelagibius litoralis]
MRICVEVCGGLFAALVLIVAVAVWRFLEGPVQINFLKPYLQEAFSEIGGNTLEIGETFLVWEDRSRDIVLHAADIVVRDPEGKRVASLPEVAFELSSSAMLQGTVAPSQIEIIGPRIRLLRSADGNINFGGDGGRFEVPETTEGSIEDLATDAGPDGAAGNDEALILGGIIKELLSERTPGNPLSFLDEVRIRDGQIFVRDDMLDLSWAAPAAEISLRRDIVGLAGDISLGFVGQRDPATLDAAFIFDKQARVVDFAAGFSDISLAALAAAFPRLAPVGGVTSRIGGSVATSISLDGDIGPTGFEVHGLAGTLTIPGLAMEPLPVRDLVMKGRYDDGASRFDLDEARISLGSEEAPGPVLSLAGVFDHEPQTGGDWTIDANAKLEGMALAELSRYWPESVAADARPWVVENIASGNVQLATADVQILVPDGDFEAADLASLSGSLKYSDLVVHYLRPLPPITDIAGTATFDASAIKFTAESGSLLSLALGKSAVEITGLDTADKSRKIYEQLTVQAKAAGPVFDALTILEHPRLDLISKLGLSAAGSGGALTADLGFQFPLIKTLGFDDLDFQVGATVRDAALANVLLGQDMADGRLALSLDANGMEISGPLQLGGVPLTMQWKESFLANPKFRTVLEADIPSLDDAGRERIGLDFDGFLKGPVAAKVSMVGLDGGFSTLQVAADLQRAELTVSDIHWAKEAGTEGSLRVAVDLDSNGPVAYRDITLQAGDLVARGEARPGPEGKGLGWMRFERVAFGRSDLEDVIVEQSGGGFSAIIGRGILDAEPFVSKDEEPDGGDASEPQTDTAEGQGQAAAPKVFEPLSIRAADLERLYFSEDRRLEQVNLELVRGTAGWETIRLSGSIPEQYWSPRDAAEAEAEGVDPEAVVALDRRYLQLSLAPDAAGSGLRLLAKSDDLGALLRAVNITDSIVGGNIQVTGSSAGPSPTHPINAKVVARDFVMVKAPVLAKLLTVASFTGVLNLLSGEGIGFDGLDGEFVLDDGEATTELMRIYGASLGLTARGKIDFDEDAIDLVGTVVPAYSINNFLSNIPLLGPVLTGGEGEGLIAVVYGVKGPVDDPQVSVNPLSALTPGFLRGIFTADPGTDKIEAVPERIDR